MPALFAWLASAVAGARGFVLFIAGRKAAFAGLYIAAYIAIVIAFTVGINGALSFAANSAPSHSLLAAGLSLVPSNASFLIAQISAAYAASWLYRFHLVVLHLKVKA